MAAAQPPFLHRLLEPHTWRHRLWVFVRDLNVWVILSDGILVTFWLLALKARVQDIQPRLPRGLPSHLVALIATYVVVRIANVFYRANRRRSRLTAREERVKPYLAKLHTHAFGDCEGALRYTGVRYTLFQPDAISPSWLVAQVRYEYGQEHVRARHSRARYSRDMGHTGTAWNRLPDTQGRCGLFVRFPEFDGREDMERHYRQLGMPRRIARAVSNYMMGVRALYSIRLVSADGLRDHGVLSIDVAQDVAAHLDVNRWPDAQTLAGSVHELLACLEIERQVEGR